MTGVPRAIQQHSGEKGPLIAVLQDIQEVSGYLPAADLEKVAVELGVPISEVYAVATFYSQFRLQPTGKHTVRACDGTSCHVCRATAILKAVQDELGVSDGETTPDGLFTLETVACLGACFLAPVLVVDEDYYGRVTPAKARDIIRRYR